MCYVRDTFTPHASRLTPHASRLTPHASRLKAIDSFPGAKGFFIRITLVLCAIVLLGAVESQANAAGTGKASPNMLCITCNPPGHPFPVSGSLSGASISGTATPSEQTISATIAPPSGMPGYSVVINNASHTMEVWFPNGYATLEVYQENGANYIAIAAHVTTPGDDATSGGPLAVGGGGAQPMIKDEGGMTCSARYDDDGDWIAGDPNCADEIETLENSIFIGPTIDMNWVNSVSNFYINNQSQIIGCTIIVGSAAAFLLSLLGPDEVGTLAGSTVLWSSRLVQVGNFIGGISGYFTTEWDNCMG